METNSNDGEQMIIAALHPSSLSLMPLTSIMHVEEKNSSSNGSSVWIPLKRKNLSDEKKKILERYEKLPKMSQVQAAKELGFLGRLGTISWGTGTRLSPVTRLVVREGNHTMIQQLKLLLFSGLPMPRKEGSYFRIPHSAEGRGNHRRWEKAISLQ